MYVLLCISLYSHIIVLLIIRYMYVIFNYYMVNLGIDRLSDIMALLHVRQSQLLHKSVLPLIDWSASWACYMYININYNINQSCHWPTARHHGLGFNLAWHFLLDIFQYCSFTEGALAFSSRPMIRLLININWRSYHFESWLLSLIVIVM